MAVDRRGRRGGAGAQLDRYALTAHRLRRHRPRSSARSVGEWRCGRCAGPDSRRWACRSASEGSELAPLAARGGVKGRISGHQQQLAKRLRARERAGKLTLRDRYRQAGPASSGLLRLRRSDRSDITRVNHQSETPRCHAPGRLRERLRRGGDCVSFPADLSSRFPLPCLLDMPIRGVSGRFGGESSASSAGVVTAWSAPVRAARYRGRSAARARGARGT